jgi:HK97 family phage portal protein
MFRWLSKLRTRWYPMSSTPEGFFLSRPATSSRLVATPDEALSLSPIFAALRLYQTTIASLPLITYREVDNGREEAKDRPEFGLLNSRPNPAQTRNVFWSVIARELFFHGEAFIQLQWAGNNKLLGLYPIPHSRIEDVIVDTEWSKAYVIRHEDMSRDVLRDTEVAHIIACPDEHGIRGISFLRYAAEALGLHKQVSEAANAYYKNAARPSGYIKFPTRLTDEAIQSLRANFKQQYAGTANAGEIPILSEGGDFQLVSSTSAEDARIVEMLSASVGDIARWTQVSALILGDYQSAKYGSLAAENQSLFQKSFRWLVEAIEAELSFKLFSLESNLFCEFDTTDLLRGDIKTEAEVHTMYLTAGVMTRNEVRDRLNLPRIPALDTPLAPLNQGASTTPIVSPTQLPPSDDEVAI